jgi:hypothetical protein
MLNMSKSVETQILFKNIQHIFTPTGVHCYDCNLILDD